MSVLQGHGAAPDRLRARVPRGSRGYRGPRPPRASAPSAAVKEPAACPRGSVIPEAVQPGRAGLSCRSDAVYAHPPSRAERRLDAPGLTSHPHRCRVGGLPRQGTGLGSEPVCGLRTSLPACEAAPWAPCQSLSLCRPPTPRSGGAPAAPWGHDLRPRPSHWSAKSLGASPRSARGAPKDSPHCPACGGL